MAGDLPFLDSFDHYLSAHGVQKWSSGVGVVAGGGRRGTAGAEVSGFQPLYRTFDGEYSTLYCGGAFQGAVGGSPFTVSNALSGISAEMHAIGDGRFQMKVNGPGGGLGYVGTAFTPPILASRWYYLEMKAVVSVSAITVRFRINERSVLTDSWSFPTPFSGGAPHVGWATFSIQGRSGGLITKVDDVYVDDGAGGSDDWFGDINIDVIRPDGVGGDSAWVPTTAVANWNNTKDINPDDGSTIVSSAFVNNEDEYTMEDIPPDLLPVAIQGLISVKKSTAGLAAMKIKYLAASSVAVYSSEFYPSETDYWYARDGRKSVDGALTSASINAMQFGMKRTQ